MVTHQHRILMIMESMKFEYEVVDIAGPGMDDAKDFMRANSKKKENERHALPPQIFNGEKYCGVSFYLKNSKLFIYFDGKMMCGPIYYLHLYYMMGKQDRNYLRND